MLAGELGAGAQCAAHDGEPAVLGGEGAPDVVEGREVVPHQALVGAQLNGFLDKKGSEGVVVREPDHAQAAAAVGDEELVRDGAEVALGMLERP